MTKSLKGTIAIYKLFRTMVIDDIIILLKVSKLYQMFIHNGCPSIFLIVRWSDRFAIKFVHISYKTGICIWRAIDRCFHIVITHAIIVSIHCVTERTQCDNSHIKHGTIPGKHVALRNYYIILIHKKCYSVKDQGQYHFCKFVQHFLTHT